MTVVDFAKALACHRMVSSDQSPYAVSSIFE